ncbi:MAG TPA: alpha/beta hydrolase [Chloroflexota bacterium]|nr:alpha/beta hydrolase [Chloroflexota bacterium]
MSSEHEQIVLETGRRVAVHRLVDGDLARTVVLCHPTPGAGAFDPDPEQTWRRGVTLLGVDRPGYGYSDPLPDSAGGTVAAAADDLAAVLDRLETGPVGVAGWSIGGCVALALAARRPDLVGRVAVLATPAPHDQVPWIPAKQQAILDALRDLAPDKVHPTLRRQLEPLMSQIVGSDELVAVLAAGHVDKAGLAGGGARERLDHMLKAAFAQGVTGMARDIARYYLQPWGFEFDAVEAKALLLYGSADPVAGSRHGTWWQKRLPAARLEVSPGAGHLLILDRWKRVLSHLAPHAQRQS